MTPQPQPAATQPKGLFGLTRKQRRLLWYAFSFAVLAGIGAAIYLYFANAQGRAQEQFQEAMKFLKPGNYEKAIAGFDRAIDTWPGYADAYFERGSARHILGQDEQALADFEKAVELNPNLYRAYAAIGSIYRARNDLKRAMEAYTKSIAAKPNVDAFFERGQTYESLGEHQKAIEDYDRAILELPDAPAVYRARSLARRNIGDQAGYESDRDAANQIEHRQ